LKLFLPEFEELSVSNEMFLTKYGFLYPLMQPKLQGGCPMRSVLRIRDDNEDNADVDDCNDE